jgi:phospholipase/carboxylesterase
MTASRFSRSFGPRESDRGKGQPAGALDQTTSDADTAAEVILSSESATRQGVCARTRPALRPCGVFVPENYEPNYAYPLVVWLHDAGRSERDIVHVLPHISMRNYLGLALRGTAPANPRAQGDDEASAGYGWSRSQRMRLVFEDELHASVRRLRQDFHVHTERIFLAGAGDGGTLAWEIFLARPEWFAGLAVFGGRFPYRRRPLRRYRELRGKHVFLAANSLDPAGLNRTEQLGRLLYSAGLEVSVRSHLPGRRWPRSLYRHVDHWIMQAIGGCP